MKIFVVLGVDVTHFYSSGHAEIHYAGVVEEDAEKAKREAISSHDDDWKVLLEVWEDGKKIERDDATEE